MFKNQHNFRTWTIQYFSNVSSIVTDCFMIQTVFWRGGITTRTCTSRSKTCSPREMTGNTTRVPRNSRRSMEVSPHSESTIFISGLAKARRDRINRPNFRLRLFSFWAMSKRIQMLDVHGVLESTPNSTNPQPSFLAARTNEVMKKWIIPACPIQGSSWCRNFLYFELSKSSTYSREPIQSAISNLKRKKHVRTKCIEWNVLMLQTKTPKQNLL